MTADARLLTLGARWERLEAMWGPAPETRQATLGAVQHRIENDIAEIPATTAMALVIKAKIIIGIENDPDSFVTELARQLVSDLERLANT